ncbi:hypothetical protein EMCRGX_G025074 [Ephydatia muelleri]|eukprot:Em0015g1247a
MVRFKNRYFLVGFRFASQEESARALKILTHKSLVDLIRDAILSLHGQYGVSCVQKSLSVKYINVDTSVAIIRCPRDYHRQVWAALTTITNIQQCPCTAQVLHLGGTIQSCQKFLIKYNTQKLRGMLRESDSLAERKRMGEKIKAVLQRDSVALNV